MTVRSSHHASAEARQWYVRLQDDVTTAAEREAFVAWLTADIAHQLAWDAVAHQMQMLERDIATVAPILAGRYPMLASAAADNAGGSLSAGIAAASSTVTPFQKPLARRRVLRMAAAVGTLSLGGGIAARQLVTADDFHTGPGQRRQCSLADGSAVEIGSDTAFTIDFTPEERRIRLREGDAFFVAAADAARPFVVQAGDVRVQALGTQFSLRIRGETVDVAVREHAVAVKVAGQPTRRVAAGEGMRIASGSIGAVVPVDLAVAEAWRQDRLIFDDAALGDVVAELRRYRRSQILITDQALAGLRVSGSFRTDDTDAVLRIIAAALPVQIEDFLGLVTLVRPLT